MRLLPREHDRLLLFLAAELARRRRARGVALSQAEAEALIADTVCEAARDGLGYDGARRAGYAAVSESDVIDGVAGLVDRVEVEALFADGPLLVVLEDPVTRSQPPDGDEVDVPWLSRDTPLDVANRADVAVGVTSHFHVFELNRRLAFDRRRAWGMRLAVPVGVKVLVAPGTTRRVYLTPITGRRVVHGHGGLVAGPLDAPGALDEALRLARERGYLGA